MKTLERRLGLSGVLAISVSSMLGSGLFVLPGLAAAKTGPSIWLAYLCAGLCVLPAALSKAELATAMPTSGGTYVYIERTFGPLAGTIAGLGLWASMLLKSAFALVGFGAYLSVFADVPLKLTSLTLLVFVLTINIVGVQAVSKIGKIVVFFVLIGMVGLVVGGAFVYDPRLLEPSMPNGTGGFLAAVAFVYVSYAGVTKVAAIAEEVKDPNRNLPLGIMISLGVAMAVYATVVHVLVAVIPYQELTHDLRPIYTLAQRVAGSRIALAIAVLGVVTMTTMAISGVLATSRFPFAMARDNLLPPALSRLNLRFVTPANAILLTGVVMALAILFLEVEKIAKLASGFKIMIFMAVNASVIVLRESDTRWYQPGFRSPLYPWLQIVGIGLGAVLLVAMGLTALLAAIGIALPSAAFYWVYGRKRTKRRGVVGIFGKRRDLLADSSSRIDIHNSGGGKWKDASVFVPLFGKERSPETLVEIGVAMADGRRVEVLHITQIPEGLSMDDMSDEDPLIESLRRRIEALAQDRDIDVQFDTTVSRDVVRTIHDVADRVGCEWTVMEWHGLDARYRVGLSSPIGWLEDHLPCNLAVVKNAGVRRIREILVYSKPGPHDRAMLECADRLALDHGATLSFAHYEPSDMAPQAMMELAEYTEQLSHKSVTRTRQQLTVSGPDEIHALARAAAAFDLMVIGADAHRSLWSALVGTASDRIIRAAPCAVIRVKSASGVGAGKAHSDAPAAATVDLDACLERRWMGACIDVENREQLFERAAKDLAAIRGTSPDQVLEALLERERIHPTALGNGIAVPHGIVLDLKRTWLGVYTTVRPIDCEAADDQPVDVFFFTVGPNEARQTHLMMLSGVARLVTGTPVLEKLRAATTDEEVFLAMQQAIRGT